MTGVAHQKVNAGHLKRNAYLYVRQSTLRQVFENTESTKRQYGLRQHAVALGWPVERIIVIDSDLGQSGASAVDREGFQKLVTEVGLGKAGIVLGLEVSRLARNSTDWHLHVLRARLQGGILNKARRGELECPLPVGFLYNAQHQPVLDPDKQVQESIRFFFDTFRRCGSACAVVRAFRQKGLLFPRRLKKGPNKGDLVWAELPHSRTLHLLHNPRYTGAFVYGRSRTRPNPDGSTSYTRLPREQWMLFKNAHSGYISWEQYEENLLRLRENAQAIGADRRKSPPREGPALLQGMVVCGRCGSRMTVRYHTRQGRLIPDYVCQRDGVEHAIAICQHVVGEHIDKAVGQLLVESVTPLALEVTLAVQQELQARVDEVDQLRKKQVERARYAADLAQRRYLHVDPANRLVADSLEADWNEKLRLLTEAQERYEQQRQHDRAVIDEQQRARIAALASDFPRLWQDPRTPDRERKRMVRLLLEDVTLIRQDQITVHVRFKGGATQTLTLPRPLTAWELKMTPAQVVAEIDQLMDDRTDKEIVEILNGRGTLSGEGKPFTSRIIARLRRDYQLKPRYDRLREKGFLTIEEISERLNVPPLRVRIWRSHGLLKAYPANDKDAWLYEDPGPDPPRRAPGVRLANRRRFDNNAAHGLQEVQYEA